jgi:exosortase
MLDLTGIQATLEGNIIHLPGIDRLWVADACSGIRSLISLGSLAILAILVWQRHWSLRLAVLVASVPIAVFVNGLRIWLTGLLSVQYGPEAAQGFFHFFEGFVLFAVAALLLLGWAALLAWIFPARRAS